MYVVVNDSTAVYIQKMSIVRKSPTKIVQHAAFERLNGYFAVYKPQDILPRQVASRVKHALLRDLNALPEGYQESVVSVIPDEARLEQNPSALTAISIPSLRSHPLVRGPKYKYLKIGIITEGHDLKSSGVMALALRDGVKKVEFYQESRLPSIYTVHGRLGFATFSHDIEGKIVEKSTYDHITKPRLEKVLSGLLRSSQKEMIRHSGVNIQSQEAYELAARGLLQPSGDIPVLLLDMRCSRFEPPDFEIEVQCVRESAQYLRRVINNIGLFLRSNAVAVKVRKIQDGPFKLEHSLVRKDWRLDPITEAVRTCNPLMKTFNLLPLELQKDEILSQKLVERNLFREIEDIEEV